MSALRPADNKLSPSNLTIKSTLQSDSTYTDIEEPRMKLFATIIRFHYFCYFCST